MSKLWLLPVLALLSFAAACSKGADASSPQMLTMSTGGSQPSFLDRMPRAPFVTRYYARRRVVQSVPGSGVLEYTEKVWADGQGGFTVQPEQLLQPQLPTAQANLFLLLQTGREGFMYRVRDFAVQDVRLLLREYTIEAIGTHIAVAGQSCERLRVRSLKPQSNYFELDVPAQTGLILRSVEFTPQGVEVGRVETLEYSATPDLTGLTMHQDIPSQDLDLSNTTAQLGYQLRAPTYIPAGFELSHAERLDVAGEVWARLAFHNGAEQAFLLHRKLPGGPSMAEPVEKHNLRVFRLGAWTLLQATVNQHRFIAAGRLAEEQLRLMIESALP